MNSKNFFFKINLGLVLSIAPITLKAQELKSQLTTSGLIENCKSNTNSCASLVSDYHQFTMNQFQKRFYTKQEARTLIQSSVQNRIQIRNELIGLNFETSQELRKLFITLRDQEDYLALHSQIQPQLDNKEEIDFNSQPTPLKDYSSKYENYITQKGPNSSAFDFKDGDLLITRGVSWFSAIIANASSNKNHFSHGVFVTKNQNGIEGTVESYLTSGGVDRYTMSQALKNENARIQIYRLKNPDLASKASTYVQNHFVDQRTKVAYDYKNDMNSSKTLTCIEIPYWGFKEASQGQIVIPEVPSTLYASKRNLLSDLNLQTGLFFAPSDMELDSRFELIAEWTDYRFTKINMLKDVVSEKLIEWTTNYNMNYKSSFTTFILGSFIIKPILQFFGVVPNNLPKNYTIAASKIMDTAEELNKIADRYYHLFYKQSLEHLGSPTQSIYPPPSKKDISDALEYQRMAEVERINQNQGPTPIHDLFD